MLSDSDLLAPTARCTGMSPLKGGIGSDLRLLGCLNCFTPLVPDYLVGRKSKGKCPPLILTDARPNKRAKYLLSEKTIDEC